VLHVERLRPDGVERHEAEAETEHENGERKLQTEAPLPLLRRGRGFSTTRVGRKVSSCMSSGGSGAAAGEEISHRFDSRKAGGARVPPHKKGADDAAPFGNVDRI
jgi:hypothetical protein